MMSIHQPRSSIFQLIDDLILLAEGRLVYSGPGGKTAVNYFTKIGFKCPQFHNPADYFLDIISVDNRSTDLQDKSEKRVKLLIEEFDKYSKQAKEQEAPVIYCFFSFCFWLFILFFLIFDFLIFLRLCFRIVCN